MKKKELSLILRAMVMALVILGVILCINLPGLLQQKLAINHATLIAHVLVYLTAIPYFVALYDLWTMIDVSMEEGFITQSNAKTLQRIARLSGIEVGIYFIVAFAALLTLSISIGTMILIMSIILMGFMITIVSSVGSYLIQESLKYKEDSESVI